MKSTNYHLTNFEKYNTRVETWTYDKCAKVKPVICNRYTDIRVPNVMKTLEKGYLPTHSVIVMGRAVKDMTNYKKGEFFRLDGNTRFDVWKIRPDLIPQVNFTVIIFDLETWEDVEKVYYSLDSAKSVEKSSDIMTGYLRRKSYTAKSELMKKGQFKRALELACRYGDDKNGTYLQTAPDGVKLAHFWDVLSQMDKMGITDFGKRRTSAMLGVLLMVGKKHGAKSPRFELLFNNFKNGLTTVNNANYVDGVHYVYNNLYEKYKQMWSSANSWGATKSDHIVKSLYAFDKFMNGENISKKPNTFPRQKELEEFFQYYNERKKVS